MLNVKIKWFIYLPSYYIEEKNHHF
jgi:hypothetical protein